MLCLMYFRMPGLCGSVVVEGLYLTKTPSAQPQPAVASPKALFEANKPSCDDHRQIEEIRILPKMAYGGR